MNRRHWSVALFALLGCSNLQDVGGVVALEVTAPDSPLIEVNETVQLSVRALNSDGESVDAPIVWTAADTTVAVDAASGLVTAVAPGVGRVSASVGSLSSGVVAFNVLAPADTLIIAGDSIFTVTEDVAESPALQLQLQSFSPPGPLAGRQVVYTITSPDPATTTPTVGFADGLTADTVTTASDGTTTTTLTRLTGFVPPLTVVVTISATKTRGASVPGSGQHFTVSFE